MAIRGNFVMVIMNRASKVWIFELYTDRVYEWTVIFMYLTHVGE